MARVSASFAGFLPKAGLGFASVLVAALAMVLAPPARAERAPESPQSCGDGSANHLRVDPPQVSVRLFYRGTVLKVHADLPRQQPVAVVFEGAYGHVELKRSGRVWGVLWMTVGNVEFANVPTVYLVSTSGPLASLNSDAARERYGLGYEALATRAGGDRSLFDEFVKLKEKTGLFSVQEGGVHFEPADSGGVHLSASLLLSPKVPAGQYRIRLVGFDGDNAQCLGSLSVPVEHRGFVRALHDLAFEHGLLYGCIAVVIAVVAGLGTGLIFGKGGKH
jgi:hypothetical protein